MADFNNRLIDYIVILVYLGLVLFISFLYKKKQQSVKEYFLGAVDVPWWAVTFSIIASETSTLTFISIPGLAYITNLNFLQVTFGYLIGRVIVAKYFLPAYFKGELTTAYSFLENRFGIKTRSIASIIFLFTRAAAEGVRLFAAAIPLKLLLGIDYTYAILIVALISFIYSWAGGVKGIIWVDVLQMGVYIVGAVVALIIIFENKTTPFSALFQADKLQVFNLNFGSSIGEFFAKPYTLLSGIIGGTFLSMSSHGADQLIVQKLLATRNLKTAQKALTASGILIIIQFAIFLMIGSGLFLFYGKLNLKSDEIFPKFIIENLPTGLSGFVVAGLLAAALSSLAASISSMSSSTIFDLLKKKVTNLKNQSAVILVLSIGWTSILVVSSFLFMNSSKALVELALGISSFTFGGLLGVFLLGLLNNKANEKTAIISLCVTTFSMIFIIINNLTSWTWFIFIGVSITLITGFIFTGFVAKFFPNKFNK